MANSITFTRWSNAVANSITFEIQLESAARDDDQVYTDAARVVVSSVTGLYPVRQQTQLSEHGGHRVFSITVYEHKIPRRWMDDGLSLVRRGVFRAVHCRGEVFESDGLRVDFDWHIVPDETYTGGVTFENKNDGLKASTKWDGCTHLWMDTNDAEEECYHHICDLDKFADDLKAQRERARLYFAGEVAGEFGCAPLGEDERLQRIAEIQQQEQRSHVPFFTSDKE